MTGAILQVLVSADAAHYAGVIDIKEQTRAMQMQLDTVQLIDAGEPLVLCCCSSPIKAHLL